MYRLLIADDEAIERLVLYKTLSRNLEGQCEIFQAENGREALQIYQEKKIQIAILDVEMPGINGIEAAEKIRETDRDCCIIFLTAFDEFNYAKKAIAVRALDYLLKPYDEQELLSVVEQAMQVADEAAQWGSAPRRPRPQRPAPVPEGVNPEGSPDLGDLRISRVTELIGQYIQDNYMFDISMQDVARWLNYSEAYFCKLFKQCFGKNFTSYLTEYRVEEAKKLLEQPAVNVREVGNAVGYGDSNYFAKVFKRITGLSPTEYRLGADKEEGR
jgi:two-component system response regulator YesN